MNGFKSQFLLNPEITFLNHGSYGSCPVPIFDKYQEWQRKLENQPVQFFTKDLYQGLLRSRTSLSKFIGCNENEILFFDNPTIAIANIIHSVNLEPGSEVLMTDHEYGALIRAWNIWGQKSGVKIIQQKIELPVTSHQNFIDDFLKGVTKRTKIIFISQITSPTGIVFPLKEIIRYVNDRGILSIVDGAHGPGQINIDMKDLKCDFYTGALHKWLCMPKGTSFLYVKNEHQDWMRPMINSWGKYGEDPGPSEFLQNFQWQGTRDMSRFLIVPDSLDYFKKNILPNRNNCYSMVLDAYSKLESILGTKPLSNGENWLRQMVSHPLKKNIPKNIKDILLNEHNIEIPIFKWKDSLLIRLSVQCYNNEEDIDSLMKALGSIV